METKERLDNLDFIIGYMLKERGEEIALPASLREKQRLMQALMNVRQPDGVTEDFLQAQDAELQQQRADKGIVTLEDVAREGITGKAGEGVQLYVWQGDITRLQVDAIVNAANAQLLGCFAPLHACIDNAIHSAAGIQLREECYALMQAQGHEEPTGKAKITGGYNLPSKHVLHTVGPIISIGLPTGRQELQLASCYRSCLEEAERHALESIAFCCISTGVFRFPNERAAEIAVETVRQFPCQSVKTVVFNVFKDKDLELYRRLV